MSSEGEILDPVEETRRLMESAPKCYVKRAVVKGRDMIRVETPVGNKYIPFDEDLLGKLRGLCKARRGVVRSVETPRRSIDDTQL